MSADAITTFGFDWGPMKVTRCCTLPGHHVLQVKTIAGQEIDIYVSNAGRKIRVFGRDRSEWTPGSESGSDHA
jgi:hypothetical protein